MNTYTVSVDYFAADAESPEDAVRMMIAWLDDYLTVAGYRVESADGTSVFIDAETLDLDGDSSIVESPSGWSFRTEQENGDNVDCWECGNPLSDDYVIVNDAEGYAYHQACRGDV